MYCICGTCGCMYCICGTCGCMYCICGTCGCTYCICGCTYCTYKGAKAYIRTAIVKDTLKPTIHLSFGRKTFHKSSAADTGINSQANPSGKLMAETSSVSGWVIGAIASAVAGVALLALGSKKVATSVPV
jgi:hypothetical protein